MNVILFMRESYDNFGGVEGQILDIASAFYKRKLFYPILVTSKQNATLYNRFREFGFQAYAIPMRKKDDGGVSKSIDCIKSLIKMYNVSVIQAHSERESFIARKIKKIFPGLINVFRVHTYINSSHIPIWRKYIYHKYDKLTSKYVDKYVCISEFVIKELLYDSKINQSKICLIPDMSKVLAPLDKFDEIDNSKPFSPNIAMVANLKPGKGHGLLIESLAILKQRGIKLFVRLIGDESTGSAGPSKKPFTESLKLKAAQRGVMDLFDFYGYTDDLYQALKGYPVVVLPSESEGTPNCILQAISLKKLVVASCVGGIPEIIRHNVNGVLHSARDPDALADVLEKVFTMPAKTWEPMREAGYETWKEKFSEEKVINGFIDIYKGLGAVT